MTCAMPRVCMQDTDSRTRPSIPMSAPVSEQSERMSVMGYFKKLLHRQDPPDVSHSPACPSSLLWNKAFLHHGLVPQRSA